MNNIINKLISNFIIRVWIIPSLLLIFSFYNILSIASPFSFSVTSYNQLFTPLQKVDDQVLLKGDQYKGSFIAKDNKLGSISLKIKSAKPVEYDKDDMLKFQLSDAANGKILYENEYRSGSLVSLEYFPIGFPVQTDSKDKKYIFLLTSQKGNNNNGVWVVDTPPSMQSHYTFTKQEIMNSLPSMAGFLGKKLQFILSDSILVYAAFAHFLPLLFYIFTILFSSRGKANPYTPEIFILIFIIMDIFYLEKIYLGIQFSLFFVWILLLYRHKLESSVTFAYAFLFAFMALFSQVFDQRGFLDKASMWMYYFFVIGMVQRVFELNSREKKKSLRYVIDTLRKKIT